MQRDASRLAVMLFGLWLAFFCDAAAGQAAQRPVPSTPQTIAVYAKVLHHFNPQLPSWQSHDLARHLLANCERWHIDTNMLVAVVTVESSWHTHAVSSAGAIGLGQLMPGTAAMLGVDPRNAIENIAGAARYLAGLTQRFGPHYDLVFAAYNAGPKAVNEYGGIPPYSETQQYVVKVLDAWHHVARMVHLPPDIFEDAVAAHGADVDYWLDGSDAMR